MSGHGNIRDDKTQSGTTSQKGRKADSAELAERLRANLRRRKQQQKARGHSTPRKPHDK